MKKWANRCDNGNVNAEQLPNFGSNRTNTDNAGAFYLNSNTASNANTNIGSQLCFIQVN